MIEAPEPPHRHVASGHKWFDIILAVAVLAVSLGSLYVAYHTSYTMEKLVEQNARLVRANSTPVLSFSTGNTFDGKQEIRFILGNGGVGPAKVVWLELRKDGKAVLPEQVLNDAKVAVGAAEPPTIYTSAVTGTILPAGQSSSFLVVPLTPESGPIWRHLNLSRFDLEVEACYCSLLGECWQDTLTDDAEAVHVDRCSSEGRLAIRS